MEQCDIAEQMVQVSRRFMHGEIAREIRVSVSLTSTMIVLGLLQRHINLVIREISISIAKTDGCMTAQKLDTTSTKCVGKYHLLGSYKAIPKAEVRALYVE